MTPLRSFSLLVAGAVALSAQTPAELAEKHCGACHIVTNPTIEKVKHLAAPPLWGVARQLKRQIKDKKAFVDFVVDYALEPSEKKIRFNKEAMKRFGLMPSMKGIVSKKELKSIAGFMFDNY